MYEYPSTISYTPLLLQGDKHIHDACPFLFFLHYIFISKDYQSKLVEQNAIHPQAPAGKAAS